MIMPVMLNISLIDTKKLPNTATKIYRNKLANTLSTCENSISHTTADM